MRTIVRVVNYDKRSWVDTLRPKGVEFGHNGCHDVIENGHMIPGLKMASKAFIVICDVELGKPDMLPESPGRDPVRENEGIVGRGFGKKRMTSCNEVYRGSEFALTRKGADLPMVFHCMNGGKPVYVSCSITPTGERLTGIRSKLQWADVDWNKVGKYANRLQARITKAVKEQKRHLGQRKKKQPLRIPTVNDRIVQMLHVFSLNGKEILRVALTTECHRNKLLPDTERVMKCLSGMKGNFHVPF